MKLRNLNIATLLILAITFMSFSALKDKTVNVEKSKIEWKGYKVTGEHEGTIKLKSGTLIFDGKTLTGGSFVIDMTSINTTDLDGEYKNKLDGHLKSDDFFGVTDHPTATLNITSASGKEGRYKVKGDITIKGKTENIGFTMTVKSNTATAQLKIDRTKFGIRYGSSSFFDNLKDKAIYDEFDLNVNLVF